MAPEIKATVIAKDGKALLGNDFHTLKDMSQNTFTTNLIMIFLRYLHNLDKKEVVIFHSEEKLVAIPLKPTYESIPFAVCNLSSSPILKIISGAVNRRLSLKEIEQLLADLRTYWNGSECKDLFDTIRNFSLKKLVTFERKKDNAGNFHFSYSRKDEAGDIEPPPPISFKSVPIFYLHDDVIGELEFEVVMDYVQSEESADVFYILRNPLYETIVTAAKKEVIDDYLKSETIETYWGTVELVKKDDRWKYLSNGI